MNALRNISLEFYLKGILREIYIGSTLGGGGIL